MRTAQLRASVITIIVLTAMSAARGEGAPLEAELKQCPPVVFIRRPAQGRKGTNGTMLGQRTKIGSAICTYDPRHPERGAKTIFDAPEGFILDMSLSYDAQKVLFSFMDNIREEKDSFHIWEYQDKNIFCTQGLWTINPDGTRLQLIYINTGPTGNFQPLQSGSWASKLTELIESEHAGVKMDDQSRRRIYVWIDSNVPYYSTWDMSRPYTMGGRDTWAENKNTMASWYLEFETVFKSNCASCHNSTDKPKIDHTWINLTRPQFSRALNAHLSEQAGGLGLAKTKRNQSPPLFEDRSDPVYLAMLRAIRQGKKALDAKPRVDMPGATAVAQQRDFGKLY
ncbi:MAG: hypothetical protein ISS70_16705 [Phycisphaerae bacterium]|nr:hypothetical protein [Phycisphaerae bacterium]